MAMAPVDAGEEARELEPQTRPRTAAVTQARLPLHRRRPPGLRKRFRLGQADVTRRGSRAVAAVALKKWLWIFLCTGK